MRLAGWRIETVLSWLFVLGGLSLMIASGILSSRAIRMSRGARARGVVVDLRTAQGRGLRTFAPVFRFHDKQRQEVTVTSPVSSSDPFRIGDEVPVLYNPNDPSDAEIESFGQLWLIPAGICTVGLGLSGMGGAALILNRRS